MIEASWSARCDECRAYAGSEPTHEALLNSLEASGWDVSDGSQTCGAHRDWPPGTRVRVSAGVNPIGQGRTHQGHLTLEGGMTRIWSCGHKHPVDTSDDWPSRAFECARIYADQRQWEVTS